MANNRMYLVHQPSGLGFGLGKRMGWGWYSGWGGRQPGEYINAMNHFYDLCLAECEQSSDQDDFVVVLESDESKWEATGEMVARGIIRFRKVGT